MDKHEAGEVNMDTKALDGREAVVEMVREARVDAAEDRFLTNRANMDMADRVISIVALVFGAVCVCPARARAVCLATAGCKGYTLGTTTRETTTKVPVPLWWFLFLREGRGADGRPYGRRYCR